VKLLTRRFKAGYILIFYTEDKLIPLSLLNLYSNILRCKTSLILHLYDINIILQPLNYKPTLPCKVKLDPPCLQVGALKEPLGFPVTPQGMHTSSLRRLPKDLICRINIFALSLTGQAIFIPPI